MVNDSSQLIKDYCKDVIYLARDYLFLEYNDNPTSKTDITKSFKERIGGSDAEIVFLSLSIKTGKHNLRSKEEIQQFIEKSHGFPKNLLYR